MVSFVLALWLFRGRNCGYGQVMAKLAGGLYCQQRGADLLAGKLAPGVDAGGGRRWWLPNISSLSRGRAKLGADPVRMLFEHAAGPADGTHGRGFQPDPARTAPMGKGQVPDSLRGQHPEPVVLLTAVAPHRGQLRGRVEHELLGFVGHLGDQQHPGAGRRLVQDRAHRG
jgi:hypothetical protein